MNAVWRKWRLCIGRIILTPWCRVLLEKLTGLQLVKKFPEFHGTRRFFATLTSVRHLSLSWASPIQSIYPHSTSWRSVLILSTHLRLGFRSGLLPSGFATKTPLLTHTRHMPSPFKFSILSHPHYWVSWENHTNSYMRRAPAKGRVVHTDTQIGIKKHWFF